MGHGLFPFSAGSLKDSQAIQGHLKVSRTILATQRQGAHVQSSASSSTANAGEEQIGCHIPASPQIAERATAAGREKYPDPTPDAASPFSRSVQLPQTPKPCCMVKNTPQCCSQEGATHIGAFRAMVIKLAAK